MKKPLFLLLYLAEFAAAASFRAEELHPFPTVYLAHNDTNFVAWADGYTEVNLEEGSDSPIYWDPVLTLGPAKETGHDVLSLGRGGSVTLTFSAGIRDGEGADFAVFENGFPGFLELAWVEVSSDGVHFTRFPNYSANASGDAVEARKVFGLAGKFFEGQGTPFDLANLNAAYEAAMDGNTDFTAEYLAQLTNGFPRLDLERVTHVRIVDVVGDGTTALDSQGTGIVDPYPTSITAGFDLDAIGVLNQPEPEGAPQAIDFAEIPHQKLAFGSVELNASTDSGLPLRYVVNGPASETNGVLFFAATGVVEVVASQTGNEVFAPASSVTRSFRVAEEVQHVFVEPVPNLLAGGAPIRLNAYASSGLPVKLQVMDGAAGTWIDEDSHILTLGAEANRVTLRAFQPGDATHAPAADVIVEFELVEAGASNAPISLADWLRERSAPESRVEAVEDPYGRAALGLTVDRDPRVSAFARLKRSRDLISWSDAVPEIIGATASNLTLRARVDETNAFYRVEWEAF